MTAVRTERLSYCPNSCVLRDVSVEIDEGAFVLIKGPNGAGKSTFLKCLVGVIRCKGLVEIYGVKLGENPAQIRKLVGYAPQIPKFPSLYVEKIVQLHLELHGISKHPQEVLEEIDMQPLAKKRADVLSGGERQRLSLALAFIHNPKLLILDEPFNNLDATWKKYFLEKLSQIEGSSTVLVVSHDAGLPYNSELEFHNGEVVYAGSRRDT